MEVWESPLWSLFGEEEGWVSWDRIHERVRAGADELRGHLRAFVDSGFSLQEDPVRGCRILDRPDRLFPPWIQSGLRTRIVGKTLHYAHTMESTQLEAIRRANMGAPDGTVVLCEYQSRGRGRRGRSWTAPPHTGILMSLLVLQPGPPEESFIWTQIASLAVAEAAQGVIPERVWIKWPNDLYLRGRKLGGVLAELTSLGGGKDAMVVGIGVNVMAAPSQARQAICLGDVISAPPPRAVLVRGILEAFESWCERVRSHGQAVAWEAWLGRSWVLGKRVRVEQGERSVQGWVEGFLPDGRLRLRRDSGDRATFSAGDVSVLPAQAPEDTS